MCWKCSHVQQHHATSTQRSQRHINGPICASVRFSTCSCDQGFAAGVVCLKSGASLEEKVQRFSELMKDLSALTQREFFLAHKAFGLKSVHTKRISLPPAKKQETQHWAHC